MFINIELQAFLRNDFRINNKNNPGEYIGTVTDGTYKLEVLVKNGSVELSKFEVGLKLEMIGDLQMKGIVVSVN